MSRLLLVDIDGTVADSPRCEHTPEGLAAWERSIIESPPPPVPGAIEGVARLARDADRVWFVTARSARLRRATAEWIQSRIRLASLYLSMGHDAPDSGGRIYKAARIARLQGDWDSVTLVDDDAEMRHALRPGDTFLHAPACWEVR